MTRIITATIASPFLLGAMLSGIALGQMASTPSCEQALILANGINLNIEDQKQEQASVVKLQAVLSKNPVDAKAFAAAKEDLLAFVNNGIQIRQMNQAITPRGNKATAGLAKVSENPPYILWHARSLESTRKTENADTTFVMRSQQVANAQLEELNLATSLSGNPAQDNKVLQTLAGDFAGGIMVNMQNLMDVSQPCCSAQVFLLSVDRQSHDLMLTPEVFRLP